MKIGLFVPCYVDALYPEVGVSTYKLLRSLGLDVDYPEKQTCCGQPMGNAGFERMSVPLAEKYDDLFRSFDYVVAPSASCAAYVRLFHPAQLKGKMPDHDCLASRKTMDVVEFLHDVLKVESLPAEFPFKVSVHNSCHGVRELGLSSPSERNVPKFNKIIDLLKLVKGGAHLTSPQWIALTIGFVTAFFVAWGVIAWFMDYVKKHDFKLFGWYRIVLGLILLILFFCGVV